MTSSLRGTGALLVLTAAIFLLSPAGAATASCAMPPPLEEALAGAPIVFVGTALAVRDGTSARFRVEEIWSGPDLEEVVIHGAGGPDAQTSVDRTWELGRRYLVLPYSESGELRDNSCTQTQPWTEELAVHRPAAARTVTPTATAGDDGADRRVLFGLLAALVTATAATTAVRRRRGTGA